MSVATGNLSERERETEGNNLDIGRIKVQGVPEFLFLAVRHLRAFARYKYINTMRMSKGEDMLSS